MTSRWFWQPVMVGAIIFVLLGCFFIGFFLAVLTCPGLHWACLSSTQTFFTNLLSSAPRTAPIILIGGLIGGLLGALFAVIRKRVRGKGKKVSQSE